MLPVMPRAMRVEYPGAIYHVMDWGDRREDIFVDDVDRQDFLKTLAEACRKTRWQVHAYETTLPVKWIAARVQIGTTKGAKSLLHHLAHREPRHKSARANRAYAQLEFQSTV
jgi:hypothetical protein